MIIAYLAALALILLLAMFSPEILEGAERRIKGWGKYLIQLNIWWSVRAKAVKRAFIIVAAVVAFGQTVGFVLFMYEEALQTTMFATWQMPTGGDREPLGKTYRAILDASWATLYGIGWLNPLAFGSYRAYFLSAEQWYLNAYGLHP